MTAYMCKTGGKAYAFELHDGTLIKVETNVNGKGNLIFHVDLNGYQKGPNRAGRDYFCFGKGVNSPRVIPCGSSVSPTAVDSNCAKTSNGDLCAAKIAKDGWQIKYDW